MPTRQAATGTMNRSVEPRRDAAGRIGRSMRVGMCLACVVATTGATSARAGARSDGATRIAVFGFELDDASPAGERGTATTTEASLKAATAAAREQLESSGRYDLVSIDGADPKLVRGRSFRDCDGCEAAVALKLGAQQSMLGIVRRVTQTDYYVAIIIRDAKSGNVVNSQVANFAGGEEGWASGVRSLMRRQVLAR